MLAKPTRGIADILSRFEGKRLTCEYKYDGLRGQVHYFNGNIKIFSRNLEDITEAYIDLVENIKKNMEGKESELTSFIVDCEIVAVNKATKQLLSFQVLSTRSRKTSKIN
jgi:DNA ligase-1